MEKPLRNKRKNIYIYIYIYIYMLIGQVGSSQTLKSLPQRMSKMDDFSFVGVNAMFETNMHIRGEIEKTNSTQITGPGHCSSSVSYEINSLKGNAGSWSCWNLLT